jgi:hypothetical protein
MMLSRFPILSTPSGSSSRWHPLLAALLTVFLASSGVAQGHEDEIVANLAGGRVIVFVAKDVILFAAIDQPVEKNSIPPRVMNLDASHIGVLLGASEWRIPADPKPIRIDRDFHRVGANERRTDITPGEAEPDLDAIGITFLEKLRPLVGQLHHKLNFVADDPIFQLVIIGYGSDQYGPEVWVAEYRMEQQQIATRGEYWQTRILRPRYTQLYPPEKHAPRTLVEVRYPVNLKGPRLSELIQGNDPRVMQLASKEPRYNKVLENLHGGQAQKAAPLDSIDFMRALLPLVTNNASFVMGTMAEQHGFEWIVPPVEPVEKVEQDKKRPPEAPSLLRKPPKP